MKLVSFSGVENANAKPLKLMEQDDIEDYFTTFQRMMQVLGVEEGQWINRLAPQLMDHAQQEYAAMPTTGVAHYQQIKAAVLRQSEEVTFY